MIKTKKQYKEAKTRIDELSALSAIRKLTDAEAKEAAKLLADTAKYELKKQ